MPLDRPDAPGAGWLVRRRLPSATIISMTCRRRATNSPRACACGVGDRPRRRPDRLGEMGDRRGIEPVGLGQLAGGAGKVADLARVDHRQRQLRRGDRARHHASRSRRSPPSRPGPEPARRNRSTSAARAFTVARDGEGFAARPHMHIQPILRDIDTDKGFHVPSLRMRAYPGLAVGRPRRLFGLRKPADGAPRSGAG